MTHDGKEDNVEEIYRALGGLPGVFAIAVAGAALFWRTKFPQIGLDYLQKELEVNRKEIAAADQDRKTLREEVRHVKIDMEGLERRYLETLQEKELIAHDLRVTKRLLKECRCGAASQPGDPDR